MVCYWHEAREGRGGSDMGGGSPGTTAPGHAQGRQGKREKGESGGGWPVGRPAEWVPPVSEGTREGERMVSGPGCNSNKI
jgi:hypothetical protein